MKIVALALTLAASPVLAQAIAPPPVRPVAPDVTAPGSLATSSGYYKLPPRRDLTVDRDVVTERWATVYFPTAPGATPRPLLIFLHGNHGTCGQIQRDGTRIDNDVSYTDTGTCPPGYVVTPNQEGYAYLATNLASHGYIVVSINANRGINGAGGVFGDEGLNLRRGRLVLRHLQTLTQYNKGIGVPATLGFNPKGQIDFSQVGLMGHSRGGEGVRAAVAQYRDKGSPWAKRISPNLVFRSIFEIAPVDGQTGRVLDADGLTWSILLGLCDGDVSDLQGQRVYDRMIGKLVETTSNYPKSTFAVAGANHNFFNTEWQQSDSAPTDCVGQKPLFASSAPGSAQQRKTSIYTLVSQMRATVGADAVRTDALLFNPAFVLPQPLASVSRFERGHTVSASLLDTVVFNDFAGLALGKFFNGANVSIGDVSEHSSFFGPVVDKQLMAAQIDWVRTGAAPYFDADWSSNEVPRDISARKTLSFRVSSTASLPGRTVFSVALVDGLGHVSTALPINRYVTLAGGVRVIFSGFHQTLPTARIPLDAFTGVALTDIRNVRFIFDRTPKGQVAITNIRFDDQDDRTLLPSATMRADATSAESASSDAPASVSAAREAPATARIVAIRRATAADPAARTTGEVEIELAGSTHFPVTDALPALTLGDKIFTRSRFGPSGRTDRLIFTISAADFDAIAQGVTASVRLGSDARAVGTIDKTLMR